MYIKCTVATRCITVASNHLPLCMPLVSMVLNMAQLLFSPTHSHDMFSLQFSFCLLFKGMFKLSNIYAARDDLRCIDKTTNVRAVHDRLTLKWATSLLGFIALALIPISWDLYTFGATIQKWTHLASLKAWITRPKFLGRKFSPYQAEAFEVSVCLASWFFESKIQVLP